MARSSQKGQDGKKKYRITGGQSCQQRGWQGQRIAAKASLGTETVMKTE